MSEQFAGNPELYPEDYTIPDDSGPPTSVMHNVAHEALGHRTAWLKQRVVALQTLTKRVEALNWLRRTTSIDDLEFAVYDHGTRGWLAGGDQRNLRSSTDFGVTWSNTNLLSLVGGDLDPLTDGAFDGLGKAVIAAKSKDVFVFSTSWARKAVHASSEDGADGAIVYDPVHSLWCAAAEFNADGVLIATASDPAGTWTARSRPSGMDQGTVPGGVAMAVHKVDGRIVLATTHSDGTMLLITSTDGGVTWSAVTSVALGLASVLNPILGVSVSVNESTGEWIAIATKRSNTDSGFAASAVLRSTNGTSWTKVAGLTSSLLSHAAPTVSAWVSVARTGGKAEVVLSEDGGATWLRTGMVLEGSEHRGAYAGGGALIALTDEYAYTSLRTGMPELGALT